MQKKIIEQIILKTERDFPLFYHFSTSSTKQKLGESTAVKYDVDNLNGFQFVGQVEYKIPCIPKFTDER